MIRKEEQSHFSLALSLSHAHTATNSLALSIFLLVCLSVCVAFTTSLDSLVVAISLSTRVVLALVAENKTPMDFNFI